MKDDPELWTVSDICAVYDISRPTLHRWRKEDSFPKPLATFGGRGGVWAPEAVRRYVHLRRLRRPAMRGAAVGRYRATGNVAQVARELGKSRTTIRLWLIELGEIEG